LQAEYTIPGNTSDVSPHVQKASIPMKKGGYLIYATTHMHAGVVNATLYGEVINNVYIILYIYIYIYIFFMIGCIIL